VTEINYTRMADRIDLRAAHVPLLKSAFEQLSCNQQTLLIGYFNYAKPTYQECARTYGVAGSTYGGWIKDALLNLVMRVEEEMLND
tara:strand:+ start:607 stop:864 length:258 start_codon:yes stop_codon:yes gene_type:complete